MIKFFKYTCIIFLVVSVKAKQPNYNIIWNAQSQNSSQSMPCGGGDIGMNVWVENGDILIYVARSGSFNEDNALLKAGRIRIKLLPNIFAGKIFKQELHINQGYITIDGENKGIKATVKIWAEVQNSIAHVEVNSSKKVMVEAAYESWRYQDRIVKARENFANSYKWAAPKNNVYKKDEISFSNNGVLFYHYNSSKTIFDETVKQQGLQAIEAQMFNPLKNLATGGLFKGNHFIEAGVYTGEYSGTDYKGFKLKSKFAAKTHELTLTLNTNQVTDINEWKQQLNAITSTKTAFAENLIWWNSFWNRSFIQIDKYNEGSTDWNVGRNYQLFRFMLACNAKGNWPTKFNGGLFTVDPIHADTGNKGLTPDYRNWGGGIHTAQNQRLVYFPMLKSGDWDLLQPQLNFYLHLLKNADLRSKIYWNHGGACFTEQLENFGLPNYAEYGTKRPADFDKGLEYNAWLEYEWDTVLEFCLMMLEEETYTGKNISDRIPFIESCLTFFDEHYQYLANQRGSKKLDANGKLVLYPSSAAETFKMAYNSTSTIAALQVITHRLLASKYLPASKQRHWKAFQLRIPPLNFSNTYGHATIAPALHWERVNNTESPQLYPVYPWSIYGVGLPGLDTAINTWNYDTNVVKFRGHIGWKQDNIWAARLGLTNEAWRLTSLKLQNSSNKFPAFWGPGFDWTPDHNHGGSGMIGLQEMLIQTIDKRILLFPAWPKDKDVHFKLHEPYNTTVEAELKDGKVIMLKVFPESRRGDVEVMIN